MRINPAITGEVFQSLQRLQAATSYAEKQRRRDTLRQAGYYLQETDMAPFVELFKGVSAPDPDDAHALAIGLSVAAARGLNAAHAQLTEIASYAFWEKLPATLSRQERVRLYEAALRGMSYSRTWPTLREGVALSGFTDAEQKAVKQALADADVRHKQYLEGYPYLYEMLPEWHKRKDLSGEAPWLADVNAPSVLPARGSATPR